MTVNMHGKVVLITGATDGIGRQAARELAAMGALVVAAGRSRQKCEQTIAELAQINPGQQHHYLLADLSSMAEVKALAEGFRQHHSRLDVLVNNAGAGFVRRNLTVDGFEQTFALNHLAYFLLTRLLLDMVSATPNSRIINTSSGSHYRGRIHFADPHLRRGYTFMRAYAQSKLANVMFTYALARRLAGTQTTTNCFHPGLVRTGIFRKVPLVGPLVDWFISLNAVSVEEGAKTLVFLASHAQAVEVSGKYWYQQQVRKTNPLSYDLEAQERLWQISEEMVAGWSG